MSDLSISRPGRIALVSISVAAIVAGMLTSTGPASAFGPRGPYVRGGYHHHRGLGVGAAIGLGVLGAAAAGAAASHYYNGYPVYPDGAHTGYGYDYYPGNGGYYGPY